MRSAKLALLCGLGAVVVSGCASTTNPVAGSTGARAQHPGRAALDDPRAKRLACMTEHHLPASAVGQTDIQIGAPPGGATVDFAPTPGAAQALQIYARVPGAEVIGSALVYPNHAPESELQVIENCAAISVKG